MRYLMLMTVAGSLMYGGNWVWERLCKDLITQKMKFWALVAVLLAFVMPWAWLKEPYSIVLTAATSQMTSADGQIALVRMADISTQDKAYKTQDYVFLLVFLGAWFLVTARYVARKIAIFIRTRRHIMSLVDRQRDMAAEKVLKSMYKFRPFRFRPRVYKSPFPGATISFGIFRPIILLQDDCNEEELTLLLKHELCHITRGDLLIRLFLEFAGCLHWFNPLIGSLELRFDGVSEMSCDEKVISGCTKEQRAIYAKLIIRSMQNGKKDFMMTNSLESGYDDAVERVRLIMNTRQISKWGKALATGVFALILFVDSLTALAYPNVYHIEAEENRIISAMAEENGTFLHNRMELDANIAIENILYDEQIVSLDGTISPVDSVSPQGLICDIIGHDKEACYFTTHVKDDNGGCTLTTYNAHKCTRCTHVWVGSLYSTLTYPVCPH